MHIERTEALRRAAGADHGVLATLERVRGADLIPVCFAIVGEWVAVPIDSVKPKGSTALGRVRNLERDPRATLLAEHWDSHDWSQLWWVRLSLRLAQPPDGVDAELVQALRDRYPPYRDAPFTKVLAFRIERVVGWSATRPAA